MKPKMQMGAGDYITQEFRAEMDKWLIEFFGYEEDDQQPAHTEAEVQELMEFAKHHALGTFSDATIEDKFRRVLGVPKP